MKRKKNKKSVAHAAQVAEMKARGYVTVAEAASMIAVPKPTIYWWIQKQVVQSERIGIRWVYVRVADLKRLAPAMFKAA